MMEDGVGKPVSPTIRLTAWLLIGMFVTVILGSYVARTEIVARGQGKVIPTNRVQVVQPQVDGKIVKILVVEGQSVKAGDLLVAMDTTTVESEIKRIEVSIERQLQEEAVARSIIAPLSNTDPTSEGFVETGMVVFQREKTSLPAKINGADALVEAVLSALRDQVAQANAQLTRIARSRDAQQVRLEHARSDREIVSQRFASAEMLRKQGTISEFDYLERLREQKSIESEALIAERELDGLAAEAEAMIKQRTSVISTALSTYRKQLNDAEIVLQGLNADLRAATNQLANLSLKAPASGRIEKLSVFTVGGFVEAGSTLMSIVPSDDDIEIEAFFDNRDVGFLESGQQAFVKFDAFPAERFGIVHGRVTSVGADARGDVVPDKWVYVVRLKLERRNIQMAERSIKFAPGMTATIDVITGERRLISYFFEPILKAIQDSFGER
ncbi:MAG: HlyD family type I secretion periplasmic adaptor subunit [Mesorhizobium sp.]|nr:MAG: HlyD family type I secretion periplasmic adaptor subunit [Mesorhizobium sp.]TJW45327.1 MAG: HlyD family type I secretion periplasmic adaptor subunit [Mesorhizobium sp.]